MNYGSGDVVEFRGRHRPAWRGRRAQVVTLGRGPGPRNVLIRFLDTQERVVTPRGCCRLAERRAGSQLELPLNEAIFEVGQKVWIEGNYPFSPTPFSKPGVVLEILPQPPRHHFREYHYFVGLEGYGYLCPHAPYGWIGMMDERQETELKPRH